MLTIAGIPVEVISLDETAEMIGERGRAEDGSLWSQVRARKRVWSTTSALVTSTQEAALKAAIGLDAIVTVTRTSDSVSMQAMVRVETVGSFAATSAGILRRLSIVCTEV